VASDSKKKLLIFLNIIYPPFFVYDNIYNLRKMSKKVCFLKRTKMQIGSEQKFNILRFKGLLSFDNVSLENT